MSKTETFTVVLGLISAALGCGGDSRCSVKNCQILNDCALRLPSSPTARQCVTAPGYTIDQYWQYCAKGCEANGDGAVVDCVVKNFGPACEKVGTPRPPFDQILATCDPYPSSADAGTPSAGYEACINQCVTTNSACNNACPASDSNTCFSCSYDCNQTVLQCYNTCH